MLKDPQAAELLKLKPGTLRVWRHKRQGPPWYQFGKSVCYERGELLEWVKKQRQVPGGEAA